MDFKAYQSRLSALSARFNLMVFLVFGLLISNGLLVLLLMYTTLNQRIEITPFFSNNGYIKSASQVDAHYVSQMSENFIYSRLNVTPETVDSNHKHLLTFVDSRSYAGMLARLKKEAGTIRTKKLSSSFDITSIRISPDILQADISGVLRRYVGLSALPEIRQNYHITYRYRFGRLSLLSFTQIKELPHA